MVRRVGTSRHGSRSKFAKPQKSKGKISIRSFFRKYKDGERVCLKCEPGYQKAIYPSRFHGKAGVICGSSGDCYKVKVMDHSRPKIFVVHPIHLKQIK